MLTEFLLVGRGPAPSVWCHSPAFGPPAESRQMQFTLFCLSVLQQEKQKSKVEKNGIASMKDRKTHVFDVTGGDGLAVHVDGSFCEDYDVEP